MRFEVSLVDIHELRQLSVCPTRTVFKPTRKAASDLGRTPPDLAEELGEHNWIDIDVLDEGERGQLDTRSTKGSTSIQACAEESTNLL